MTENNNENVANNITNQKIQIIKKQLEIAKGVLELYANKTNWSDDEKGLVSSIFEAYGFVEAEDALKRIKELEK